MIFVLKSISAISLEYLFLTNSLLFSFENTEEIILPPLENNPAEGTPCLTKASGARSATVSTTSEILFQADQSDNYGFLFFEGFGNVPMQPSYNSANKLSTIYASPFIEIPTIPSGTFSLTNQFTSESTVHTTSIDLSNSMPLELISNIIFLAFSSGRGT